MPRNFDEDFRQYIQTWNTLFGPDATEGIHMGMAITKLTKLQLGRALISLGEALSDYDSARGLCDGLRMQMAARRATLYEARLLL